MMRRRVVRKVKRRATRKRRVAAPAVVTQILGVDAVPIDAAGLTEYQRLCLARAKAQEFENAKQRGLYLSKEEVEIERAETAQVIQSDLGALGKRLAGHLSGKKFKPEEVTRAVDEAVREMVARWASSGNVDAEAVPA